MHRQTANYAEKAIDKYAVNERHFLGITMGVNEETYSKIAAEIENCCRKIASITADTRQLNQVYRLNLQLFPFTKKI